MASSINIGSEKKYGNNSFGKNQAMQLECVQFCCYASVSRKKAKQKHRNQKFHTFFSDVRFSVHSSASKEQQAQREPSSAQGLNRSVVSPGRG